MTENNDDVFDLNKEMKDKGFKSPLGQFIKRNPYWVFLYNWGIINEGAPRVVAAVEIIDCFRRCQFPPIGKNWMDTLNGKEYTRNYYKTHKDLWVGYYLKNKEAIDEYHKEYRKKNKHKAYETLKEWKANNRDWYNSTELKRNRRLKEQTLTHYSNDKLSCVICGESRLDCLSIDHINGNGTEHRRKLGRNGNSFYRWLKGNNYPDGYRTLCMNCQFIEHLSKIRKDMANKYSYIGKN